MIKKKLLFRNSFFNLLNGFSSFLFVLFIPKILLPVLGKSEYSLVALITNLTSYIGFFAVAIQTGIAKFIAQSSVKNDYLSQKEYLNVGFIILIFTVLCAIIFTFIVAILMPKTMLPESLYSLRKDFSYSILIFGVITSIGLFYNIYAGYYIGTLRNHFFSVSQFIFKLITLMYIYIYISYFCGKSIVWIIAIISFGNFCLMPVLAYTFHKFEMKNTIGKFELLRILSKNKLKEVFRFCLNLSVWNFAMLFITSSTLYLVGYFDFKHVTEFSLATVIINVCVGILGSACAPLIPYFSHLFQSKAQNVKIILLKQTLLIFCISVIFIAFFHLFGHAIIGMLFGSKYIEHVYQLAFIMLIGFMIRNLALPFAMFLVASGQQILGIKIAVIEAVTNFMASLILGVSFLSVGVAWGGVIGSALALGLFVLLLLPKVKYVSI